MKIAQDRLGGIAINAGIGVVGQFVGRFLSVLESLIAARVLGPHAFGLFALGLTVFRLIERVSPLGFDIGIIKYGVSELQTGNNQGVKETIIYSSVISFSFSALLGVALFLSAPWLASELFKQEGLTIVLKLFAPIIPLSGLLAILSATSRLKLKVKYSIAMQDLGQPLLALTFLLIFLISGLVLEKVVLAEIFSYFISVLVALYFLKKLFPFIFENPQPLSVPEKEYFRYSITSSASIFLSTLVLWVDRLLVGVYLPSSYVGIYQAALQISVIFAILMSSFSRILMPTFSALHAKRKFDELEEVFRIGTKWGLFIGLPIILFIFMNSDGLLGIIYGSAYSIGGLALSILLIGQLVNMATGTVGPMLLVGGYYRIVLYLSITVLIFNSILCAFLVPRLGIVGAAISNTSSIALMYLLTLLFVRLKMKLWPYDMRYLKGIVAIGVAVVFALIIKFSFSGFYVYNLVFQFVALVLAFGLTLLLLGLSQEDRVFTRVILERLGIKHKLL